MVNNFVSIILLLSYLNSHAASKMVEENEQRVGIIKKIDLKKKIYIVKTNDKKEHQVAQDDLQADTSLEKLNAGDAIMFIKHREATNK